MTSFLNRMLHAVGLGRVKVLDDSGPVQLIQVDQGPLPDGSRKIIDTVPALAHFGLASCPPLDSDVVLARLAGNRSATIAIGTNHQEHRLRGLQPGESALYDANGGFIWWRTADGLVIDAAGQDITVRNFGSCTVDGDLHVTGDVISRAGGDEVSLNGLRDAYNAHAHGGVQAGGDTSGTTDHEA